MKLNKFPVLRITNIKWDEDHEEFEKLPKSFELKWNTVKWNIDEVSNWISLKFDWIFSDINIEQIGTWKESVGCCCDGGCSCC